MELDPRLDQVVFAGDSLRLRCRVSGGEEDHAPGRVWWRRGNIHLHPVTSKSGISSSYLTSESTFQRKRRSIVNSGASGSLNNQNYDDIIVHTIKGDEGVER